METLMAAGHCRVFHRPAEPKMQFHLPVRIPVPQLREQPLRHHVEAGFLPAFPHGAIPRRFPRYAFSAGKLGQSGQHLTSLALADEVFSARFHNGDADLRSRVVHADRIAESASKDETLNRDRRERSLRSRFNRKR